MLYVGIKTDNLGNKQLVMHDNMKSYRLEMSNQNPILSISDEYKDKISLDNNKIIINTTDILPDPNKLKLQGTDYVVIRLMEAYLTDREEFNELLCKYKSVLKSREVWRKCISE